VRVLIAVNKLVVPTGYFLRDICGGAGCVHIELMVVLCSQEVPAVTILWPVGIG